MKIHQVLPTITDGDAISNEVFEIRKLLVEQGYKSEIFAQNIDKSISAKIIKYKKIFRYLKEDDVLIYHKSTGTEITRELQKIHSKKIVRYHNITPKHFFEGYSNSAYELTKQGREDISFLGDVHAFIADSKYNEKELIACGYENTAVCPILIDYRIYEQSYSKPISQKMLDGKKNIIFVGRLAPNKKQEDIIKAFYYYKKFSNENSRLIFIGNYVGMEKYYLELKTLISNLNLEDVVFTGHVPFSHLLAYYKTADIYLCMSEHEGFCVPLIEAMYFDLPIIAYASSAIPETLGGEGILINKKDHLLTAELINEVIENIEFKNAILEGQRKRFDYFSYTNTKKHFIKHIQKVTRR